MANPNPNRNANQVFGISSMRAINLVNGNPDPSPSPGPSPHSNPSPSPSQVPPLKLQGVVEPPFGPLLS